MAFRLLGVTPPFLEDTHQANVFCFKLSAVCSSLPDGKFEPAKGATPKKGVVLYEGAI